MVERSDLRAIFEPLVGAEHVHRAGAQDAVDGVEPALVIAPGSSAEVAAVLRAASDAQLAVIPRGGGTKLDWGNVPRQADVVLSTARLNRLVEHAHGDMTATAEAGITIAALQVTLAQHGQMLALDPAWPEEATLGGVIAADASGPLRVRYGTMRDLLIGVEVALPDGTLAKGGGKVVKNVAGYDLMKLLTGSLGTLGVITSATIRLHPLPAATGSWCFRAPTATAAQDLVLAINASTLTPSGVQIISAEDGYAVCVRFMGVEESVRAQALQLIDRFAGGLVSHHLTENEAHAAWQAHARIYSERTEGTGDRGQGTGDKEQGAFVVARFSVLPASIATALEMLETVAARLRLERRVVVQATGTGILRFDGQNEQALLAALGTSRARFQEMNGYMAVQRMPREHKAQIDVWGSAGDALPLMRRVKQQFDPGGTLNPGRYIGRI